MKYSILIFSVSFFLITSNAQTKEADSVLVKCVINKTRSDNGIYSITVYKDKTYRIQFGEGVIGSSFFKQLVEDRKITLADSSYATLVDLETKITSLEEVKRAAHEWDATEVFIFTKSKAHFFYEGNQEQTVLGIMHRELKKLSPISFELNLPW